MNRTRKVQEKIFFTCLEIILIQIKVDSPGTKNQKDSSIRVELSI